MTHITDSFDLHDLNLLTDRLYEKLGNKTKSKTVVEKPIVQILNRKTYIKNFTKLYTSIKRDKNHLADYFADELSTKVSITGDDELLLDIVYRENPIVNVYLKYIVAYVQCKMCKSSDTSLVKSSRITQKICNNCKAFQTI